MQLCAGMRLGLAEGGQNKWGDRRSLMQAGAGLLGSPDAAVLIAGHSNHWCQFLLLRPMQVTAIIWEEREERALRKAEMEAQKVGEGRVGQQGAGQHGQGGAAGWLSGIDVVEPAGSGQQGSYSGEQG